LVSQRLTACLSGHLKLGVGKVGPSWVHPRTCKPPLDNMHALYYYGVHMETISTSQASANRLQVLTHSKELAALSTALVRIREMTKGTIYIQKRKCGNKNCKCARGELHSTRVLSYKQQGTTRLICLTKYSAAELSRIEKQVRRYQQFRRTRARIVSCFKSLITEINKLEQNVTIPAPTKKGAGDEEKGE
jgi:hypothetical protein